MRPDPGASGIEALVYESTQHFYDHLVAQHIPAYYDNYTYGTHSFPYWARDLKAYLPRMMADFAHPKSPNVISYTTIDKSWSQWGYSVSLDRSAEQEFSSLTNGTAHGFTFAGSGTATVTTPAVYRPGSDLQVSVSVGSAMSKNVVHVDSSRRVTVHIDLGGTGRATVAIRPTR